ncbi:MAG: TetR/AcrR family transcriptional regulator [Myxococcota bacterium]
MPRQRKFDEDVVLTAAMKCFWRQGYPATSMRDLEAATGLTTGSLYNGFEGKEQLFRAALRHYIHTVVQSRIARYLISGDARLGILGFVRDGLKRGTTRVNNGCFLVNTYVEGPLHERKVLDLIAEGRGMIDSALDAAVKRGMEDGTVNPVSSGEVLAQQISLLTTALLVRCRTETRRGWYEEPVALLEGLLDGHRAN